MNFRVKRVLIGASTILIAGVAYAKSNAIPAPSATSAPTVGQTGSTEALKQAVSELDQQVSQAKEQIAAQHAKAQSVSGTLKALQKEEVTAVAKAQERIQMQTQYVSQTQQPAVQTVTRASGTSGGDDSGGDD